MSHLLPKEKRLLSELRKRHTLGPRRVYTGELPRVLSVEFARCFKGVKFKSHKQLKGKGLYITRYKGRVAIVKEVEIEKRYHITEPRIIKVKTLKSAYAVCEIINPPQLERNSSGYSFEGWVPEVLDKETRKWRKATDDECEHWSKIPEKNRRVLYIIGILPEEILDEWDFLE